MRVQFLPEISEYFDELEKILYKKRYFSFEDYALEYVKDLIFDIKENLPTRQHKPAPERYAIYGEDLHYASFIKNKRTTWYAFFTKYQDENNETIHLVRYIANNRTVAQHL
jgi:hypothetical protein